MSWQPEAPYQVSSAENVSYLSLTHFSALPLLSVMGMMFFQALFSVTGKTECQIRSAQFINVMLPR